MSGKRFRRGCMTSAQGVRVRVGEGNHGGIALPLSRCLVISWVVAATLGCSRQIEEEPPVPEHRWASCETWCALMFDPVCPAQDVAVPTEEECVEHCAHEDGLWAPVGDGVDACGPTHIEYIDCLTTLSCEEIQRHFVQVNLIPPQDPPECGGLLRVQLDCQSAHY